MRGSGPRAKAQSAAAPRPDRSGVRTDGIRSDDRARGRAQTRSPGNAQNTPPRTGYPRGMTREEYERLVRYRQIAARTEREYRQRLKRERAEKRKLFGIRAFVTFMCYAVMMPLLMMMFYANLKSTDDTTPSRVLYQIGADDDSSRTRKYVDGSFVFKNGVLYADMSDISEMCKLSISGSGDSRKYISRKSGEKNESGVTVEFTADSNFVLINGVSVRMSEVAVIDGDDLFVPARFINDYVTGVKISYDSKKYKYILENEREINSAGKLVYVDAGFAPRICEPMDPLSESSIDYTAHA